MDFYRKAVQCTYVDLAKGTIDRGIVGTPQGGTMSPMLSNIMLHELDHWISKEFIEPNKAMGKSSKPNPEYKKIHTRISNLRQYFSPNYRYRKTLTPEQEQERLAEIKSLEKVRATLKSTIPASGHRVYYVRYADDFLIGVNGTYSQAFKIRKLVSKFLREELNLHLNMEKTHITDSHKGRAKFLGAEIRVIRNTTYDGKRTQRRTSTTRKTRARMPSQKVSLFAPIETIAKRLEDQGMCRIRN